MGNLVLLLLLIALLPFCEACFGGLGSMSGCCPPSAGMCGIRPPCSSSQYTSSYSYNAPPVHLPPPPPPPPPPAPLPLPPSPYGGGGNPYIQSMAAPPGHGGHGGHGGGEYAGPSHYGLESSNFHG